MTDRTPRESISAEECSLSWPDQRRNLILFACCTGLQYLAAPVLYVGITQASLCDRLGSDVTTANLPGTLYFAMTAMPALIAWLSPGISVLKRNVVLCFGSSAMTLGVTALVLASSGSDSIKLWTVILQAGFLGAAMPTAMALLWEIIGRGSSESRRGLALSLAFGVGPMLAVLGSCLQTSLLGGKLFGFEFDGIGYPNSFIILYGVGAPILALSTVLSFFFVVPPVVHEAKRETLSGVVGLLVGLPLMFAAIALLQFANLTNHPLLFRVCGCLTASGATAGFIYHFRSILLQRILLLASLVTILVYLGNMIPSNMNLYSHEALGSSPEKFAGLQNTMRFGVKVIAGFFLGWWLSRTNPRAGILMTSFFLLASQLWAMFVTGPWYLVAFGIFGAGELIGVYSPNYIVSASKPNELRRNLAFVAMLMVPAAPAGYLYGAIVDLSKSQGWSAFGLSSEALGFRLSFLFCAMFIASGITVGWIWLPKQPRRGDVSTVPQ